MFPLNPNLQWCGSLLGKIAAGHFVNRGKGLGIGSFTHFNTALLAKWLWRFAVEINAMWRIVIANKYDLIFGRGGNPCDFFVEVY